MSSGDAVIRKLPSVPVAVPLVVPCTNTLAPIIGLPDASVIFPVTVTGLDDRAGTWPIVMCRSEIWYPRPVPRSSQVERFRERAIADVQADFAVPVDVVALVEKHQSGLPFDLSGGFRESSVLHGYRDRSVQHGLLGRCL